MPDGARKKLAALNNRHVEDIIAEYTALCRPDKITLVTDDPEERARIRQIALEKDEEKALSVAGHTVHYDGFFDQGRDKACTKVLVPEGQSLSPRINTLDRKTGLAELHQLMKGIMRGKEMFVRFFCLGPGGSAFAIPAMQITDSAYVAHSEDLLYRSGYAEFHKLQGSDHFFHFIHSAGALDENGVARNVAQRRVYIDLVANRVFTINNQYAGNSVGLKKLALRLAINQANQSDWLAEHMFLMGVHPVAKERTTYFAGAFPSACGKTSTAMIPGQTIIGDDIAYLKAWSDGTCHAVNIESGIFGIISDVNPIDDPLIYKCLTTPRELIFSNVLVNDGRPYWLGMGMPTPARGTNHSGAWFEGKKDDEGKLIPLAHKNARYTMRLSELENLDPQAENPDGVPISAIIYGGRDSDTNPPIVQAFGWEHGVFIGATLESETTAATLGQEGQRTFAPMANLDFIVVPLGLYLANHFKFGKRLNKPPLVFGTNYFLKDEHGRFLNEKTDKKAWILWAEARVHGEYGAVATPIGWIPRYADLQTLFDTTLHKPYSRTDYARQFEIRLDRLLEKLARIEKMYAAESAPPTLGEQIAAQRSRLLQWRADFGRERLNPLEIEQAVAE